MILGDLGARVVKIESPGGDDARAYGPPFLEHGEARDSTYFLSVNRNKESIVLDLHVQADRSVFTQLVARADVLIENFRPGVLERLGLGVEQLQAVNPGLVILSISAYGRRGSESQRPGYDQLIQGEAGIMSLTGDGAPTKVGVPVADILAGALGAAGVGAALHQRERTGRGTVVHTSLLAAATASHAFQATQWLAGATLPRGTGNRHPSIAPYGAFACSDGLLQICAGNDAAWRRLAVVVGLDPADLRYRTNGDRLEHYSDLERDLSAAFSTQGIAHWLEELATHDVPAGRVRALDAVYDWAQVIEEQLVVTVEHSRYGSVRIPGPPVRVGASPEAAVPLAPPTLDEHGDAIRRWLAESAGLAIGDGAEGASR
jgi:crotonobetainyl-CoA:carnitine CoA-transferase CaiB-like acyl-CoA transferase